VPDDDGLRVAGSALVGEPLYQAGIDRGDVLLSMDGRSLSGARPQSLLGDARPGQAVELEIRSRGTTRTVRATLAADPTLVAATLESAGGRPSAEQAAFRELWLRAR
jgi:S1-C subfamily serine protease